MNIYKETIYTGLILTFTITFLPVYTQAEEIPDRGPIPFAAYDKDDNGLISEDEFYLARSERMSKRVAEGRPMRGAANAPAFSDFDIDTDGQLSPDELAAGQQARMQTCCGMGMRGGRGMGRGMGWNMPDFSEYDMDGDGYILEDEFYEARGKRISERLKQGYQMRNLSNAPTYADIDTDSDGEVSPEEFAVHQSQCYKRM
jgi:Ca2+-binding EF-hand superfamily protein